MEKKGKGTKGSLLLNDGKIPGILPVGIFPIRADRALKRMKEIWKKSAKIKADVRIVG